MQREKNYSYILKSSSIVGGAQGISLVIGLIRTKFVAVLLGPSGHALVGIFQSIQGMANTFAGLGINTSGIRDVAEAAGTGDEERIARTVVTLRRVCWMTGSAGGVALAGLAIPLSHLTFQSDDYSIHIACLGLIVLMCSVTAGQMALIQGMRRISDLARLNIFNSIVGTATAIGFYFWFGINGIIPALICISTIALCASFWFSRRVRIINIEITWRDSLMLAKGLITLGSAVMLTGLLGGGVEYATRTLITHEINLVAVGVYFAAYNISVMFMGVVTNAMGADFYPSLTSLSGDHHKMRNLVNQQSEMGLLLMLPGLSAIMALAPWIIQVLYTDAFSQSAELLKWCILGCVCRAVSWPLSFVMLAKNKAKIFSGVESFHQLLRIGLIITGLKLFGLKGVAIAELANSAMHTITVNLFARKLIDFRWSKVVWMMIVRTSAVFCLLFIISVSLSLIWASVLGIIVVTGVSLWCLRELCMRLEDTHIVVKLAHKLPLYRYIAD
jgi:antigen flippase